MSGQDGLSGRIGMSVAKYWKWLGAHPFKRAALNWVLWAFLVVAVIGVAAGNGSKHAKGEHCQENNPLEYFHNGRCSPAWIGAHVS